MSRASWRTPPPRRRHRLTQNRGRAPGGGRGRRRRRRSGLARRGSGASARRAAREHAPQKASGAKGRRPQRSSANREKPAERSGTPSRRCRSPHGSACTPRAAAASPPQRPPDSTPSLELQTRQAARHRRNRPTRRRARPQLSILLPSSLVVSVGRRRRVGRRQPAQPPQCRQTHRRRFVGDASQKEMEDDAPTPNPTACRRATAAAAVPCAGRTIARRRTGTFVQRRREVRTRLRRAQKRAQRARHRHPISVEAAAAATSVKIHRSLVVVAVSHRVIVIVLRRLHRRRRLFFGGVGGGRGFSRCLRCRRRRRQERRARRRARRAAAYGGTRRARSGRGTQRPCLSHPTLSRVAEEGSVQPGPMGRQGGSLFQDCGQQRGRRRRLAIFLRRLSVVDDLRQTMQHPRAGESRPEPAAACHHRRRRQRQRFGEERTQHRRQRREPEHAPPPTLHCEAFPRQFGRTESARPPPAPAAVAPPSVTAVAASAAAAARRRPLSGLDQRMQ